MSRRLNNRGFTLVELLAVLVILVAIMAIAIPTISSSLERTNEAQDESRRKVILSAAELYVSDHKNVVYKNLDANGSCYIMISDINYLTTEEMSLTSGEDLSSQFVIFTKPNTYAIVETNGGVVNPCVP